MKYLQHLTHFNWFNLMVINIAFAFSFLFLFVFVFAVLPRSLLFMGIHAGSHCGHLGSVAAVY